MWKLRRTNEGKLYIDGPDTSYHIAGGRTSTYPYSERDLEAVGLYMDSHASTYTTDTLEVIVNKAQQALDDEGYE